MYTIAPWMFSVCKGNHKLTCLFAYFWSLSQGIQAFKIESDDIKDITAYCCIPEEEVWSCVDQLLEIGAIKKNKFNCYTT